MDPIIEMPEKIFLKPITKVKILSNDENIDKTNNIIQKELCFDDKSLKNRNMKSTEFQCFISNRNPDNIIKQPAILRNHNISLNREKLNQTDLTEDKKENLQCFSTKYEENKFKKNLYLINQNNINNNSHEEMKLSKNKKEITDQSEKENQDNEEGSQLNVISNFNNCNQMLKKELTLKREKLKQMKEELLKSKENFKNLFR